MSLMTKTQIMQAVAAGRVHETFDHETDGKFDVTAMRALCAKLNWPSLRVPVSEVVDEIRQSRVIDEARIDELPQASWQNDPALVVIMKDADGNDQHLLIDGTHRILRRHKEGCEIFRAYFVPEFMVIRPDMTQWVRSEERGIDWGDAIEGDKIIKRTGG